MRLGLCLFHVGSQAPVLSFTAAQQAVEMSL